MNVNNETGIIQPIFKITKMIKKIDENIITHSDITQGVYLYHDIESKITNKLEVPDILSFSCYKMGGPHCGVVVRNKNYVIDDYDGTKDVTMIFFCAWTINDYIKNSKKNNNVCKIIKYKMKTQIENLLNNLNIKYVN